MRVLPWVLVVTMLCTSGMAAAAEGYLSPEWHGQVLGLDPEGLDVIPLEGLEVAHSKYEQTAETDPEGRFFIPATTGRLPFRWYPGFALEPYTLVVKSAGFPWFFTLRRTPNDREKFLVDLENATLVVDPEYVIAPFTVADMTVSIDDLNACGETLSGAVAMTEVARALVRRSKDQKMVDRDLAALATKQYEWVTEAWTLIDPECDGKNYADANALWKARRAVVDEASEWIRRQPDSRDADY